MRRTLTSLASVILLLGGAAHAAKKAGVTVPDTVSVDGKNLVLNGMGVREATVFNVDVYVAALYLEAKSSDGNAIMSSEQAKKIDLHFVRDVDKGDITKAWAEGFKKNGNDVNALKDRIAQLNGYMADMKKGDVLSFTYVPEKGVTVAVKGQDKGTITGADFGRAVFSNFVGPNPPNKGLKNGLLGK
jgi:hypothetical protein